MSVFVDTAVLYAHQDADAERHETAVDLVDAILDGEYGQPYTSDYVLDEAVTLTRARTDSVADADAIAKRIRGSDPHPPIVEMIYTTAASVSAGLDMFRQYDDHDLSFTDAMNVAICERREINTIASFDLDFDGIVDRVGSE